MKKSLILASMALVLGLFTACDSDRDDNPTLTVPDSFRLNTPAIAENNVIDLLNTDNITLTCDQPNYGGFPIATEYTLEYSTSANFDKDVTYTWPSSFTSTTITLQGRKLNDNLIEAYQAINGEGTTPENDFPLYMRLSAKPLNSNVESVYSNSITLPNVRATYKAPDVSIPADLYVVGSNIGEEWKTWQRLAHPYGTTGVYYTVVWMPEGGGKFKFGTKEGDWTGHSAISEFNDETNVGITADGDDKVVFGKGGWYTLEFVAKIKSNALVYTLNVYKAQVFITGKGIGGFPDDGFKLECTAPADNTGDWISPAFTTSGEMRAYVSVPNREWWRTEFTLKGGTDIFFREVTNIPDTWEAAEDADGKELGADYSVKVSAGQKLHVSFDTGKGFVE